MDFSFLPLLSIFILLASSFLLLYKKKPASSGRLPPGKTGFPVIGESYEFLSTGWKGCPEKFIHDRMAKYSSQVFKTHLLGEKAAVFCGAAGHKFLFTNENKLVEAWWPRSVDKIFPNSFKQTSSSKQEGIKMKKLLQNFLKPDVGTMDRIAQMHFSSCWENKDEVEVLPLCKNYTLWIAARLFVSVEDPTEVANLVEDFNLVASGIISVPIDLPGTPFNRAIKASNKIRKHLLGMIIKKRKLDHHHHQDIMSHMLTTRDENGKLMDELDVADKILGLLIGGHHTTASACTSIVKFLAELPHIYQGVYEEQMEIAKTKNPGDQLNREDIQKLKYSWNVACEVLRLAPPVQGGFREALEDFVFNGFSIPKGWKIYWSANSTHRKPECFPDPMNFDPSRFNGSGPARYTFVPFGGGIRMCPGKEYARIEILVFMHHLVKRFRWEKMIDDEKVIVDPMPFPAKGLPVRLFKHDHKTGCS